MPDEKHNGDDRLFILILNRSIGCWRIFCLPVYCLFYLNGQFYLANNPVVWLKMLECLEVRHIF